MDRRTLRNGRKLIDVKTAEQAKRFMGKPCRFRPSNRGGQTYDGWIAAWHPTGYAGILHWLCFSPEYERTGGGHTGAGIGGDWKGAVDQRNQQYDCVTIGHLWCRPGVLKDGQATERMELI